MTLAAEVQPGPADWVSVLASTGPPREDALRALHELLLRVARADARRRPLAIRLAGPELDDLVHQAADDALVAITARLDRFRGESRFTTWACRFVIHEVGVKIGRHRWQRESVRYEATRWTELPDRASTQPEVAAELREFAAAVRAAVDRVLTTRQREVFLAVAVHGVPLEELSVRLGTNRNALYQVMFGARRKIRAALVADGLLTDVLRESA